jgi:hypothetical protein
VSTIAMRVRYHEAGHAVVAKLLGIPVREVTARPRRGKFRGATIADLSKQKLNRAYHEKQIMILLAGSLSESKQFPDVDWEEIQGNSLTDWVVLYHHADEIARICKLPRPKRVNIPRTYPATIEIVTAIGREGATLIESNWAAIVRVAKALHRNAVLKQDVIDGLIAGAAPSSL